MNKDDYSKVSDLVNRLNEYSAAYYNTDKPLVSDEEYDKLFNRLQILEKETGIILPHSPTQVVGAMSTGIKRELEYSCLSLRKTKNEEEFMKFCGDYVALFSVKLDGLTTQLTYENGVLIKAVTRGNGTVGTDVTKHVLNYTNVPRTISYKSKLVVTGESIITQDTLKTINASLSDDEKFATCRNLASGTLNQLDPTLCRERNMKFFVFNVNELDAEVATLSGKLKMVEDFGFAIVPYTFELNDGMSVTRLLKYIAEHNKLPYDGVVVTYNDIEYGKSLGSTGHHPRSGLAYKYEDEEFETVFRSITYDVTRGRKISMVANFDPVEIDGTVVCRAVIPNYDMFRELELGEGDIILVRKANMIIPQIVDNITRSGTCQIETTCPCCGEQLELKAIKNTQDYYCNNNNCKGSFISKLVHLCSNDGLNIKGVSEATLEQLVDEGFIKEFADVFKLHEHKARISKLDGFGKTSCSNLLQAIDNSRTTNLSNYIYSLGIKGIGKKVSKQIEEYYQGLSQEDVDDMLDMTYIEGVEYALLNHKMSFITPSLWSNFMYWIDDDNYYATLRLEEQLNIVVPQAQQVNNNTVFSDKKVCVTGTLKNYSRKEISKLLEEQGASVMSGVTSATDYLICGEGAGDKLNKAKKHGVTIITEDIFEEYMISGKVNL